MSNKQFIKTFFEKVLETEEYNDDFIRNSVDKDYIQRVDGKSLGYEEFVQHIKLLKTKISTCTIEFLTLVEEGEIVFSNHIVSLTLKNGKQGKSHVIAEFRIRDGKLYYCDELTFLIEGSEKDKNLGSEH
ncbi:MAG: nuclear transport factor 2 family protein [Campylobacteraceae bacterium]|jgi:predicted SnoaL-like aldol condensation-catalyzing enzyme|nr:nuclear transport factor 2 family protein [Campylobacteraceae bacterium]